MKYNLSSYSQTIANTSVGDIDLTTDEVINILNTTAADIPIPASGTTSGTLVLDCDLGARVHVDQIRYYFEADTADPSEVAPYIEFAYRNENFEIYVSLNTYYNENYYYTIVSGTEAPRYIRVQHTVVSGTEGNIQGFQVLNDDTYVDFGPDGDQTDTNFNLSIENATVEINPIEVKNNGPVRSNVKIVLEPQDDASDNILSISTSEDGPWYGIYRDEDEIAATNTWATGSYTNTSDQSGVLKLLAGNTEGTYRARIIKLDEYQRLNSLVIKRNYPIITPDTSFFDDFSQGGIQWDIIQESYSSITFNNILNIYDLQTNPDSSEVQNKYDINYSDDFMISFRFRWPQVYSGPTYYGGTLTFSDGLYLRFSPGTDHYNGSPAYDIFTWHINGATAWDLRDVYGTNWARNNYNTWYDFKFQREFNDVRLKFWKSGDPEPGWIFSKTLDSPSDIDETGKIKLQVSYMSATRNTSLDNVKVIRHYTASATSKSIIATEDIDTLENVEIRSSNSRPMDRLTYIEAAGDKFTRHRWMETGAIAETSADWGSWGSTSNYWEYWYDSIREDEYIVDKPFYTGYYGDTEIYFRIRRKDGTLTSTKLSDADYDYSCYWSTYKLSPNFNGGFWVYFFLARTSTSNGTYYFRYYNSSLSTVYSRTATAAQGTFLYDLDSVYNTTDVWYTDRDLATVFKIDTSGNILSSYLATDEVRGIYALSDGGCWFIQGAVLQRLNSDGTLAQVIDIPSDTASYVYGDGEGGFWLHDGYVVRHLSSDGTETFSVEVEDLYHFTPFQGGVLTKHGGGTSTPKAGFISKDLKRMVREWNYPQSEGGYKGTFDYNRYGVRSHTYDDLTDDHASHFPIPIDSAWVNDSPWSTVSLRDYNFDAELYHQVRITLRADSSSNSPEVYGLYTQRAIELQNIYPGNTGTFYLKSDVSELTLSELGDYNSNLRAYWYLNTE